MQKIYHITRQAVINIIIILFLHQSCLAQNIDIDIVRSVQSNRTPTMDNVMKLISDSDYILLPAVPVGLLIGGLATKNNDLVYSSAQTAGGIAISGILALGMKEIFKRPRPFDSYNEIQNLDNETGYSMPSAHTAFAFALATSVSLQFPKWYVIVPGCLWASAVGFSRIYLGAHYPSDVVVGALVGVGSAFLSFGVEKWLLNKK